MLWPREPPVIENHKFGQISRTGTWSRAFLCLVRLLNVPAFKSVWSVTDKKVLPMTF